MYTIEKNGDHLLVKFNEIFDFPMIQTIIHHLTKIREYPGTNDIWLIGNHHADIRLGELEMMVREFQCLCPTDATRTKTAVVVDNGLTGAIISLWVEGLKNRVAFDIRIFPALEEAQAWLGVGKKRVA